MSDKNGPAVKFCFFLNKFFKLPPHPFNMQNDRVMTYPQWQFEKGEQTIKFYLERYSTDEMLKGKTVLDIGCGAGGKTLYYASQGAEMVYGIDIVESYEAEANALAKEKQLESRFKFMVADGAHTPFETGMFDTIIMNDAMEHVDEPERVLEECFRILKPGGKLYVNFPPYYHPYGAHLSDAIGMPWVQLFFSDKTLIKVYKELVRPLPDGQSRIEFRISKRDNGEEYFSYINRMTIKRFKRILAQNPFNVAYYREVPLRGFFAPLAKLPGLKELLVKMVVIVFEKK